MYRLSAVVVAIAILGFGSTRAATQDVAIDPAPDAPSHVLPESHWRLLERIREGYVRLPDGRCIDATRLLAVRRIVATGSAGRWLPNDLRAFGVGDAESGIVYRYEDLPPWHQPFDGGFICSSIGNLSSLRIQRELEPGVVRANIVGHSASFAVRGLTRFHEGGRVSDDLVLWRTGELHESGLPLYEARLVDDCVPSADQLAHAARNGLADLVFYTVDRNEHQPLHRRRSGHLVKEATVTKAGPLEVTYSWTSKPVRLGFREEAEFDDLSQDSTEIDAEVDDAPELDLLVLQDGRQFRGRVVQSDDRELVFLVIVGAIQSEMRFGASDVAHVQIAEQR